MGKTEAVAEILDDLPVGAAIAHRLHRLTHPLHPAFGVGEGAVLFGIGSAGQHHMGERHGLVGEDVLQDHQLGLGDGMLHMVFVRVAHERVFAQHIERLQLAVVQAVHHVLES
jgi:hypothetical protein